MMQQYNHSTEKKINDTLDSLNGIQKAMPAPYFYTRLQARLQQKLTIWEKISIAFNKPVIAIATVCFVIVLNAFAFLKHTDPVSASVSSSLSAEINDQNMSSVYDFASKTNTSLLKIWETENE